MDEKSERDIDFGESEIDLNDLLCRDLWLAGVGRIHRSFAARDAAHGDRVLR